MFGNGDDFNDQSRQLRATQAFASNSDNRGFTPTGNGNQRMEIGIKRHDNTSIGNSLFKNPAVAGCTHADFADV